MIGFVFVRTEDGKRAWVRADEVGTFYETTIYPKPKPGRPKADGLPVTLDVVMLTIRNGQKLAAKDETIESIINKLKQALGQQIILIDKAVYEGKDPTVPRDAEAA